jgi:lipid-binding SYLF domain-containing protein
MSCVSSGITRSNDQRGPRGSALAIRLRDVKGLESIRLANLVVSLSVLITSTSGLCAANRVKICREAREALTQLYSLSPVARHLGKSTTGVLVFPSIVKAGSNIGRQHGYGTLFADGRAIGDYELAAVSYSVPEGVGKYGYALFFIAEDALGYLRKNGGWEIGAGLSVVVVPENQKRKRQPAASANDNVDQVVTIAPSTARIRGHPSQVTRRPAMNDQQEAAPRPNDLTLDPTYRGFVPVPDRNVKRTLTTTTLRNAVYAFAFGERRLLARLRLQRTKITPIHPE